MHTVRIAAVRPACLARVTAAIPRPLIAGACAAVLLASTLPVSAATFTVNSNADTSDGSCSAFVGGCTLREAIEAAVATSGRDTIRFDASVFPRGESTDPISLTGALPIVADGAGTVIDGGDANVRINFNGAEGLVLASAPGVPLAKPTVANLILATSTGPGLSICGGFPPDCDAEVAGALVRNVVTNQTGDGIRIWGLTNKKPRVLDSVVFHCDDTGVLIVGLASLTGARVQGVTVRDCSETGILIGALGEAVGTTVLDSIVSESGDGGVQVLGGAVSKTKVTNVVAAENVGSGIYAASFDGTGGVAVTNSVVSRNDGPGIQTAGGDGTNGVIVKNVVADANSGPGVSLDGNVTGVAITRATVAGNFGSGVVLGFGGQTVGAKVSGVASVGNGGAGVVMAARGTALQKIHASVNVAEGIVLAAPGSDGNTIENATAASNEIGIRVRPGNGGNVIQQNLALGNAAADLADGNAGCGSDEWTDNVFLSGSEACVR